MNFPLYYRQEVQKAIERVDLEKVQEAIRMFKEARDHDRQIFVCGNGGSAATASHFVCDILKGASYRRIKKFKIMALTDNMPTIMAYANDVSYEEVFVEQLKNFAQPDDLVLGISGSGNSSNVIKALTYATARGCHTIALTGRNGGRMGPIAQLNINVPEPHMGRIEDAHMIICHTIGYYFMEVDTE